MKNSKLRVGVIGAGSISDIYLKNMINKFENLEVKLITSKNMDNAKKKSKEYGIKAVTTDELINSPDIDMVVILTPTPTHYELIKASLLAGKHVYTEKAVTDELSKAKELLDIANEHGLYLGAAPDTFMGAAYQMAAREIENGIIGKVQSFVISANRNNDFLMSLFTFLREPGGGAVLDYGVYYLTALISVLGPVKRVGGIVEMPYKTHVNIIPNMPEFSQVMDTPVESRVSAIIMMESGVSGTMHLDHDTIMADQAYFAIYGEKGILFLTNPNEFGGDVKILPNPVDPRVAPKPTTLWNFTQYSENSRGIGPSDLADAILYNRKNRASKELAYHVLEVLEAMLKGGETGSFFDIESTCEKPELLPLSNVPITNIGHVSFNAKNMEEMLHFYADVLGMKRQFTLKMKDLTDFLQSSSSIVQEQIMAMREKDEMPWIEYLKLSDHQYLELFHNTQGIEYKEIENRQEYYGYFKMNYEVDDIEAIKQRLVNSGVELVQDVHKVADGATEIVVNDPDGNVVQFTQYNKNGKLPLTDKRNHEVCSMVKFTTQVAYNVKDDINMKNFYCQGLGLKNVFTLTYGDLASYMEDSGAEDEMISGLRMIADKPWIDYIEVAPHQYIELFYNAGTTKTQELDLSGFTGYQHLCLEVSDIQEAKQAIMRNGIKLDTDIKLGPDGALQLWIVDPDGNRIELMEYTKDAMHLRS
ncbi:MAG: VOC family protein [Suipraeoptans sp.]